MSLRIVYAANGDVVFDAHSQDNFPDPLMLIDTQAVLLDVPLPAEGKYWLELRANDDLIGQRPFFVNSTPPFRTK